MAGSARGFLNNGGPSKEFISDINNELEDTVAQKYQININNNKNKKSESFLFYYPTD